MATFDQPHASSNGGAVLLKAVDRKLDLTRRLAATLADPHAPERVTHTLADLVAQRIFGLACGYADGNDANRLAEDPIQKLLLDRDPIGGHALASQPTLSRFENAVGPRALYQMGRELAATVIDRHRQRLSGRARRGTIDLDVTDDPTHGAQQLSFFHGHYDTWCYLPLLAFVTFSDEADAYLCAAVLRPGNAASAAGAEGVLRAIYTLIRSAFPHTTVRVRLDGGFATPALLDYLDLIGVEYVVAMAENAVLTRRAEALMVDVRAVVAASGTTTHTYADTIYAAQSWSRDRRVIMKAEVVALEGRAPRDNARFVITNLRQSPRWIYETVYCQRGEIENRIKELQSRTGDRSHELHALLGQSISRLAHGRGVCPSTGPASSRRAHRVRTGPGLDAARASAEDRRPGRRQRPSDRAPLARSASGCRRVARDRPPARRHVTSEPPHNRRHHSGALGTSGAIRGAQPSDLRTSPQCPRPPRLRPTVTRTSAFRHASPH